MTRSSQQRASVLAETFQTVKVARGSVGDGHIAQRGGHGPNFVKSIALIFGSPETSPATTLAFDPRYTKFVSYRPLPATGRTAGRDMRSAAPRQEPQPTRPSSPRRTDIRA